MCTHPFAKKALTRHLARSEGHEHYFGCNLTHRKVLASSHQYLMTEAPAVRQSHAARVYGRDNQTGDTQLSETYKCNAAEHLEVYRRPVWALHDEANTSSQDLNSHGCLPVSGVRMDVFTTRQVEELRNELLPQLTSEESAA